MLNLLPGNLYGQKIKTRVVAGFQLSEITYKPGYKVARHSHELAQFCLVREGTFSEGYGRKTREVKPMTLIVRPSGEIHEHNFHNTGSRCFVIEMQQSWLERFGQHGFTLDDSTEFSGGLSVWLAARVYEEFHRPDEASSFAIEGLMLEIIAETSRNAVKESGCKNPRWLKQVEEFIQARFTSAVNLEAIADSIDIHPVHLARAFRRGYGCSIGEYIRKLRIESACRQLSLTNTPLAEIAVTTGFYDQSHFSRKFRDTVGITPGQYRTAFRRRSSRTNKT